MLRQVYLSNVTFGVTFREVVFGKTSASGMEIGNGGVMLGLRSLGETDAENDVVGGGSVRIEVHN